MATRKIPKTTNRSYRKCGKSDSDDDDDFSADAEQSASCSAKLLELKESQKLRKRPAGLSHYELAFGEEATADIELIVDPLKLQTGGLLDLKRLKRSDWNNADVEEDLKQQFSKETHLRDEDEEMRKFVEEELAKRKGVVLGPDEHNQAKQISDASNALYALPAHLQKYQSKKTEEMLSNQMLCGIPEVDLGTEAKIRNIEETETAKLKLLKEALEKKKNLEEATTARQNLTKNLSANYVQHSIYRIDNVTTISSGAPRKPRNPHRTTTEPVPVVGEEDTPRWVPGVVVEPAVVKRNKEAIAGYRMER